MTYHNTLSLGPEEVGRRTLAAHKQDNHVLEAIKQINKECIPDEILAKLLANDATSFSTVPLTSIRRSVNTLMRHGLVRYCFTETGTIKKTMGYLGHLVGVITLVKTKP